MSEYSKGWKYIVWVGGCDDYFFTYKEAKEHYDQWIEQGYDNLFLTKILSDNEEEILHTTQKEKTHGYK